MDKEIFNRYISSHTPFDEKVLFTSRMISLEKLRKLVEETFVFLQKEGLLNEKINPPAMLGRIE